MVFQMLATMAPLLTAPEMTFIAAPLVPSEVGTYIIKNRVLLGGVTSFSNRPLPSVQST